ncbi:hypothetical protein [Candidatus Nitrososphaera sp. FF02]|uniref:hypothetical protein n=1 Tax=Candidatus Nitrososphaera sp. FF02 TaxID=3398226 RepID=UPI0039EC3C20
MRIESGKYFKVSHYNKSKYLEKRAKGMSSCYIGKADDIHLYNNLNKFGALNDTDMAWMTVKMRKLISLIAKPRKEPVFQQHEYQEFMELLYKIREIFKYHKEMTEQNAIIIRNQKKIERLEEYRLEIAKEIAKRQLQGRLTKQEVDDFIRVNSDSEKPAA